MSYDYHTWVPNEEYNRVRNQERTASIRRSQADRQQALAREQLRRADAEARRYDASYQALLSGQLAGQKAQFDRDIAAMDQQMRTQLRQLQAQTEHDLSQLRQEAAAVNSRIGQTQSRITDLSRQVSESFARIAENLAQKKDRALFYRNAFQVLLEALSTLHPDKLTPQEIISLRTAGDYVQADLDKQDYEAAIALAQNGIVDATELRARLEQLNEEYDRLVQSLDPLLERLSREFERLSDSEQNRQIVAIEGQEAEYDGDIDYWTFSPDTQASLFAQLLSRFEALYTRTTGDYLPNMNLNGLRDMLAQLSQLESRLPHCVRLAMEEFLLACQVELTAGRITDAMTLSPDGTPDHNWHPEGEGYIQDDFRRAYELRFHDGPGNTATIVILPDRGSGKQPLIRLDIRNFGPMPDSSVCAVIFSEVTARLNGRGIEVEKPDRKLPAFTLAPQNFVTQAANLGDHARINRLSTARNQMKL